MAKVILEFDPVEDREEMETAINGWKWKMLVWDLDQYLRGELKYNHTLTDPEYKVLSDIRDKLHELKSDSGLNLD